MSPECRVPYAFVVGAGGAGAPTDHGDDTVPLTVITSGPEKADMVFLNIRENMNFGKSYTWFKYAASLAADNRKTNKHRPIDYVAKADTDTLVAPSVLRYYMKRELPPAPYNLGTYAGWANGNVLLNSLYMLGQFYFVSIDLANYMGFVLDSEGRRRIARDYFAGRPNVVKMFMHEDVSVGALLNSNPMPLRNINIRRMLLWWKHPLKDEADWLAVWDGGAFDSLEKIRVHATAKSYSHGHLISFKRNCGRFEKISNTSEVVAAPSHMLTERAPRNPQARHPPPPTQGGREP